MTGDARRRAEELPFAERRLTLARDRRRLVGGVLAFALLVVAIYVLFPTIIGLDATVERLGEATWYWIVVALAFNVAAFGAYVALFQGVIGASCGAALRERLDTRASYQITMAGLAATRLFSAAGAGGLALTFWALRKAGMGRRAAVCSMVAFMALLYTAYLVALLVFGILLRTGVLRGDNPVGGTVVPAAIAGVALVVIGLMALVPHDLERRLSTFRGRSSRGSRFLGRLAAAPATVADGTRTALAYLSHPRRGALALVGAAGFWAANIGILWASFEAFGADVPVAVLVQGFFVGMAANLIPSPAGGVGAVDAGMLGAFVLFGIDAEVVFPAVLIYRAIAFWLPIPPGVLAFFQLRRTVADWEGQGAPVEPRPAAPILQKVK